MIWVRLDLGQIKFLTENIEQTGEVRLGLGWSTNYQKSY